MEISRRLQDKPPKAKKRFLKAANIKKAPLPRAADKKKPSNKKNKRSAAFSFAVVVICIALYIGLEVYESDKYPKLSQFGLNKWSAACKNENRSYYLLSDINWNEAGLSNRYLKFLNEKQEELYYTSWFEKKSLDKDGVWRFTYNPKDIRMFAEKDQSQVLKGDEKIFEIAEDFKSMAVITATGEKLTLSCRRIQ